MINIYNILYISILYMLRPIERTLNISSIIDRFKTDDEKKENTFLARDCAILPEEGVGDVYDDNYAGKYVKGDDASYFINKREQIKGSMNLVQAKLPKPVTIPKKLIIKEQVLINIANPNYASLNELNEFQQEDVLSYKRLSKSEIQAKIIMEKLKNIQNQNPILIPNNNINKRQLYSLLDK